MSPPGRRGVFAHSRIKWQGSGMVSDTARELYRLHAGVCRGLADPKRLLIIDALRDGEKTVTDLGRQLDLPQANLSQHLAILRDKGLVTARRDGQFSYYSLTSPKTLQAVDLLREVMAEQFGGEAGAAALP
jgi:ArsR family transcriptional regulator